MYLIYSLTDLDWWDDEDPQTLEALSFLGHADLEEIPEGPDLRLDTIIAGRDGDGCFCPPVFKNKLNSSCCENNVN